MGNDLQKVLLTEDEILARIQEMATDIWRDYEGKDLLLVGVLKGAILVMADLMRALPGTAPDGLDGDLVVRLRDQVVGRRADHQGPRHRHHRPARPHRRGHHRLGPDAVVDPLQPRVASPASVEICTLLRKPEVAKVEIDVRYVGFDIPNEFVVGYGLDYAEQYRNLRVVGTLRPVRLLVGPPVAAPPRAESSARFSTPGGRQVHTRERSRQSRVTWVTHTGPAERSAGTGVSGCTFTCENERETGPRTDPSRQHSQQEGRGLPRTYMDFKRILRTPMLWIVVLIGARDPRLVALRQRRLHPHRHVQGPRPHQRPARSTPPSSSTTSGWSSPSSRASPSRTATRSRTPPRCTPTTSTARGTNVVAALDAHLPPNGVHRPDRRDQLVRLDAGQPHPDHHRARSVLVPHGPDAGRRLAGHAVRQVPRQARVQGHPEGHLRRRRRVRRGGRGAPRDQGVPPGAGQVPRGRRQDPQGRPALRPARYRQDPARARRRRRGGRAVLLDLRFRLRRDVRRCRCLPRP